MTHKAETILATVTTKLTGLTTTGTNVKRDRLRKVKTAPALSIEMGSDEIINELTGGWLDCALTVNIEIIVAANSNLSSTINQIREEINIKLHEDITQGLNFVFDTEELDTDEIELSGETETPTAVLIAPWRFRYQRQRSNPSL